ncbi:putative toxin-antitoxin system toxin component, PIN family [Thermoanaerobacterium butyriciformans]|uniref:PIN family toxin of toxin-antitoxin system n=1 Tax=Thermoanaerobacterium butyriciformans TaxID=1702242 RepID=A0ABS4NCR0_9THEO|nr:putative toxin-antitoxin system toxin component, PIN family [Thermoanaerobacterium butyriciformans]MBP2070807.1 putative PIN family toxin of toxin-antitoxin system [Thermoanaerobacterium butyriciformans]
MVVVIDTNVFIDAFFHNDVMCQSILKLIICNKIQLAVSIPIVDEISNIFTEHFIKLEADLESKKYIEISKNRILALANTYNPIKKFSICLDEDDNKFFDCAFEACADYIITSDHHLFSVKKPFVNKSGASLDVVKPERFYYIYNFSQKFRIIY